jgi:hypothetical protein
LDFNITRISTHEDINMKHTTLGMSALRGGIAATLLISGVAFGQTVTMNVVPDEVAPGGSTTVQALVGGISTVCGTVNPWQYRIYSSDTDSYGDWTGFGSSQVIPPNPATQAFSTSGLNLTDGDAVQFRAGYNGQGAIPGTGSPPAQCTNGNSAVTAATIATLQIVEACDWVGETAWAAGPRYNTDQGNWATYTPYVANSTVTLYAGQTMEAGTVHFSAAVDGEVGITITLNAGWRFFDDPDMENVKVQDYAVAPSGNPSIGGFGTKGYATESPFTITVPENNFYGVHVDVEQEVCEE